MSSQPSILKIVLVSVVLGGGLAVGLVTLFAAGNFKSDCAYGSGRSRNSCKPRPAPTVDEQSAAIDGSALRHALAAFESSVDGNNKVVGVGVSRWGETSFSISTGKTAFGEPRERFVRFDRKGQPLGDNRQAGYEDVAGTIPFDAAEARPDVLVTTFARVDRPERFMNARFEPAFGNTGLAWRLTYATWGASDPQSALFAMAADGAGLCRLNEGPPSSAVPACNLARMPATPFADGPAAASATVTTVMPTLPMDDNLKQQFGRMACVKNAAGDVAALRRCVE